MQELIVKYLLTDEEVERLEKITEGYQEMGFDITKERMFDTIMCMGSKSDIENRFKFHEWKLGLREDYK